MNERTSIAMAGAVVLSLAAVLMLGGCIEGRSKVTYGPKGPPVGCRTLRQVKIGETSREWLLGTLGEPTRATVTPDGTEILTYVYTKKVDTDLEFCIFLDIDDEHEERTVCTFELTNGVVTEYWKE